MTQMPRPGAKVPPYMLLRKPRLYGALFRTSNRLRYSVKVISSFAAVGIHLA